MNAFNYIIEKQIQWALNHSVEHGIELIGSECERGLRAYTRELNQNLFRPLSPLVREQFEKGDGNEINGEPCKPSKMQALHSSSALGVNMFQYWQDINQVPAIAAACGFCQNGNNISEKIVFEDKYKIIPKRAFLKSLSLYFCTRIFAENTERAAFKGFFRKNPRCQRTKNELRNSL